MSAGALSPQSSVAPAQGPPPPWLLPVVAALFGLSGAAALVYQVAWQRILALQTGVGVYSVALIVAAFMAGLGLGSHAGGLLSRRLTRPAALSAFAIVELSIGLFAAFSCRLYYDVLYLEGARLYAPLWRAALLHFLALLPPTVLMGTSLPLLTRAMVADGASAGRTIGVLYGVNVIGAGLGALCAPWVLMRQLGIPGAVLVGAACNALAGLGSLALRRHAPADGLADGLAPPERGVAPAPTSGSSPFGLWLALYALSGFCALSLEVLWFRIVDVAVKSTAFTFGTVLSVYLLGCAGGSLLGAARVARLRRPPAAFLLCQCALLVAAALAVIVLVRLPPDLPGYAPLVRYWALTNGFRLGRVHDLRAFGALYLLLPALLYGLPTLLMGLSFPILQRAVQDDARSSGFKVGLLQAANIAGCVAGSLLVGVVSLDRLGSATSLRLVVAAGLAFAWIGWREGVRRRLFALAALALLACGAALPDEAALWSRLHGVAGPSAPPSMFAEDATGVVGMVREAGGTWNLTVNGTWNSLLPFGGIHASLGALPALVHPDPRDVAIVGLGTGTTAWAAACRTETRRVRVYEICSPQLRLLSALAASDDAPPKLRHFLRDPRLEVSFADGRHALRGDAALYDVIEADALRPDHAYSGNLYSLEFFQGCARRLKPGGVMCSWAPTTRAYETFVQAFPHVLSLSGGRVLIGSNEPLPAEPALWLERLRAPAVHAYLGTRIVEDVAARLPGARAVERGSLRPPSQLNRDLHPRDELASP